ncbi:Hsp20/alpha crystallin family protein, partial [Candidatus Roizmanbacteria bacterium]|nr:Hsp20/alpha crystallin family protein [Candidatus Roizmanbacteria bacterium]
MSSEINPTEVHPEHEDDSNPSGIISWRVTVRRPHTWRPPTDLYETEDRFIIRIEIAGMNKEEFCVSLEANTLTISGTRPDMQL